jgi:hypothetical protein
MDFLTGFFENPSNFKFNENASSGSLAVACGQTDRHTEKRTGRRAEEMDGHEDAKSRFSQLCQSP